MTIMAVPELEALWGTCLGLTLGLLIGLQRGWVLRNEPAGSRFAGFRTFGLFGLAGGIAGTLQARAAGLAFVLLLGTAALILMGYWRSTRARPKVSGTASLAGLITMALGFVAGSGDGVLASAGTGLTILVLSLRHRLHHLLTHIDEPAMAAIARFALIALVILPLLPNDPLGPYDAWRPRQLWLVVVLVSGFSFAGYIGAKLLGPSRGVLAIAAAGALVSSTAVTASLGGKLRDGTGDTAVLNAGIALAGGVMFLRVMALTAALAGFALPTLALVAVPGMLVNLGAAALMLRRGIAAGAADHGVRLRNPFDLLPALALMVLTMALTVAARWMLARYGDGGLAVMLAISGTVDVDSAIITLGNLPPGALTPRIAGLVLLPPVVLNTLFKTATLWGLAGRNGWPAMATMLASVAAVLMSMIWTIR
jgi:uncharacterized membrane protein (DUF4010 family)